MKVCSDCKSEKQDSDFYKNSYNPSRLLTCCKECLKKRMVERTRKNKQRIVSLLGGKCVRCGYSKCLRALEFHHLEPKNKIRDLNGFRSFSFSRLLEESKKCILLCANCHREEEEKIFNQVSVRE